MCAKPGVCVAADAHSTYGSHELWGEWHCRQLAEQPVRSQAKTAETVWSNDKRKKTKLATHDHFSSIVLSVGTSNSYWAKGIFRAALREKVEKTLWTMRSSSLVWRQWCLRNSRSKWYSTRTAKKSWRTWRQRLVWGIRNLKPSEAGAGEHSDPMGVDTINSLASSTGQGQGSSSLRDGCFKCGGNHFQRDCHTTQRQWPEKHTEENHGPRVLAKGGAKTNWDGLCGTPWPMVVSEMNLFDKESRTWQRKSGTPNADYCSWKNSRGWAEKILRVVCGHRGSWPRWRLSPCVQRWHRNGRATKPHNNVCRERIRAIIERTLTGKARMNAFTERVPETERVKERKWGREEGCAGDLPMESWSGEQMAVWRGGMTTRREHNEGWSETTHEKTTW